MTYSRFASFDEDDITELISEEGSKRTKKTFSKSILSTTRAKIDQVDATLFVEQRLNNVVIKVRQHLLN